MYYTANSQWYGLLGIFGSKNDAIEDIKDFSIKASWPGDYWLEEFDEQNDEYRKIINLSRVFTIEED